MQQKLNRLGVKEYDKKVKEVIYKLTNKGEGEHHYLTFSKEKVIKRIMEIEQREFMPKHIPQGTKDDPDNPDYRTFTQVEKDACWCPNCKYPYEYWSKKELEELMRTLRGFEDSFDSN